MAERRSNGEGSIRQRPDGRWIGQIRIGQVRRTVYGKSRREVADQLAQVRADALVGLATTPTAQKLHDYLVEWRRGSEHLRPTTAYLYDLLIRVHIHPVIGDVKLRDLATLHLTECYRRIPGKRTKEQVHRLLHKALGDAVRRRLIAHNPASMVDVAHAKPAKKKLWTVEQFQSFVTMAVRYETRYDTLWLFQLATSARIGEALGLKEGHVDWEHGIVRIEQEIVRVGTVRQESDPKTESGVRQIVLPSWGMDALRHQRQFAVDGYFWRTKDGNVPWTSDLQVRLKEACFRAAVPPITSHQLRKMHATLAIANGVDPKTVQNRLGHATLALTLGIYSEAMEMADVSAARVFDALVGSRTDTPLPTESTDPDASPTPDGFASRRRHSRLLRAQRARHKPILP